MENSLGRPTVRVARGVRALEELLFEDILSLLPRRPEDLGGLAAPVHLVVSSSALRQHVQSELIRRHGRALVGLRVHTLRGLALAILSGGGEDGPGTATLAGLLTRREARVENELKDAPCQSREGLAAAHASVRSLLDAGLTAEVADALEEQLLQLSGREGGQVARARALVRVAARVQDQMEELPGFLPGLLRRAAERAANDPQTMLAARAVLVHGFADATGLGADLLEAVLRHEGATLYLDRPADPAHPERDDAGLSFSRRFAERLAPGCFAAPPESTASTPTTLETFRAMGCDAEVREIARRILVQTDAGVAPERIAVVARSLVPWTTSLRVHFTRLGVPFSGAVDAREGPISPASRLGAQLASLLALRGRFPAESWLSLLGALDPGEAPLGELERADLRVALHALGVSRLSDLASLSARLATRLRDGKLSLPVRRGLLVREPSEGNEGGPHAASRKVSGERLAQLTSRAEALLAVLDARDAGNSLEQRAAALETLLEDHLLWTPGPAGAPEVREELAGLTESLPSGFAVSGEEWLELLSTTLGDLGRAAIGGEGGGVQVLSVVQARARSFDQLFIIGLCRDEFPRSIQDDPLLPDRLRAVLLAVLPDLPLSRSGFDEERYLFAQLLSSSPNVTLSWQVADDEGKPRAPSPLPERLRLAGRTHEGPLVACEHSPPEPGVTSEERELSEAVVLAGLHGRRADWSALLPGLPGEGAQPLASFRSRLLDEVDPDLTSPAGRAKRQGLGPFFGFIGEAKEAADPRGREPAVTTLQAIARCPWQSFLEKLLRLEGLPDPHGSLPGVERDFLGLVVHGVLEELLADEPSETRRTLEAARVSPAGRVRRPSAASITTTLSRCVAREAAERGLFLSRVLEAATRQAAPMVLAALDADWPSLQDEREVIGAELKGCARLSASGRTVPFTADRVDVHEGQLVLVDYKTGKPVSEAKTSKTRRKHLLAGVANGTTLQPAAYALAEGVDEAVGRLLYIKPGLAVEARAFDVASADPEFREAFEGAVTTLRDVWDGGAVFPRLTTHDGSKAGPACEYCKVREACLRGETGAHLRLAEFAVKALSREQASEGERALGQLWALGSKEKDQ